LIIEGDLLQKSAVEPLLKEANEIVAIMAASRKSAARKREKSQIANPWPRPGHSRYSERRLDTYK